MDSVGLESHTDPLERWPHTHCMVPLAIHHASEARCTSTRGLAFKHPCTPLLPAKVSQKPCSTCDPDSSRSPFADGSRSPCAIPHLMGDLDFVDSLVSLSPSSPDDSPSNHPFTSPPTNKRGAPLPAVRWTPHQAGHQVRQLGCQVDVTSSSWAAAAPVVVRIRGWV